MTESQHFGAKDLIHRARDREALSEVSARALQRPPVAEGVDRALQGSYTVRSAGEVLLVTIVPDDSGSMAGLNQNSVIQGHNELLSAMQRSTVSKRTLLQTRYLNGFSLNPFRPLHLCDEMSLSNYPCNQGTPLFEQTLITLGAVIAKSEELLTAGAASVRTATLLMTDAQSTDTHRDSLIREVAAVVRDIKRIGDNIVAGMGFTQGAARSYDSVFAEMGIAAEYRFTASGRDEVLRAFRMFGDSFLALPGSGSGRVYEG